MASKDRPYAKERRLSGATGPATPTSDTFFKPASAVLSGSQAGATVRRAPEQSVEEEAEQLLEQDREDDAEGQVLAQRHDREPQER